MSRKPWFGRASGLLILAFVFTPYFGHVAFLYLFGYLLSPLWTGRVDVETAGKERPIESVSEVDEGG
jgi:hypothetical protein